MTKKNKDQIPDLLILDKPSHVDERDVMVVLLNMGGPRTNQDVRPFQKRLFSDRRLIRFPLSFILQPFFAWMLVTFRGRASEERYQLIGGGSPIYDSTEKQTQSLKAELSRRAHHLDVIYSFNYTPPFPEDTIREIKNAGKKYILPVSLYPHYSSATTGSNLYHLKEAAKEIYPELQFLPAQPYYLADSYIQGFADRIRQTLKPGESLDDFYLIFSAHGLPLYFLTEGDPYPFQINQTAAKVLGQLNRKDRWVIAYQSAVGPMEWLKPTTQKVIETLAKKNIKKILIVPIAFVSDHIETICEIDMEYREFAQGLGVSDYRMSRALECHPGFISALADSVENSLESPGKINQGFREGVAHVYR